MVILNLSYEDYSNMAGGTPVSKHEFSEMRPVSFFQALLTEL